MSSAEPRLVSGEPAADLVTHLGQVRENPIEVEVERERLHGAHAGLGGGPASQAVVVDTRAILPERPASASS